MDQRRDQLLLPPSIHTVLVWVSLRRTEAGACQIRLCVFQSSGAYENVTIHNRISQFKACSFGGLGLATENSVLIVSRPKSAITYVRI